jgi:hypothetical protein
MKSNNMDEIEKNINQQKKKKGWEIKRMMIEFKIKTK